MSAALSPAPVRPSQLPKGFRYLLVKRISRNLFWVCVKIGKTRTPWELVRGRELERF